MNLSTRTIVRATDDPVNDLSRALAALVCAGSAGVHAGLVPAHLHESVPLGAAFGVVAVLLGLAAGLVGDRRVADRYALPVAGLLAATALAYLLSRTTGIPVLIPDTEHLDGLGAATTLFELAGATACLLLVLRREPR